MTVTKDQCVLRTAQYAGTPEENHVKNIRENDPDPSSTAQNTHSERVEVVAAVLPSSHVLWYGRS